MFLKICCRLIKEREIVDMNIQNSGALAILIGLFVFLILAAMFSGVMYCVGKNMDNNKALITKRVTILEKTLQQGKIEWYIVQEDNGERMKLRNLKADSLFISEGDRGVITYKGITIQNFVRE